MTDQIDSPPNPSDAVDLLGHEAAEKLVGGLRRRLGLRTIRDENEVREALRQVVEERRVVISRARGSACFPADVQLVAAANPCPCGWWGSRWRPCECDDASRRRYRSRLAGPLLDRVEL